jgi:hypothetical protein
MSHNVVKHCNADIGVTADNWVCAEAAGFTQNIPAAARSNAKACGCSLSEISGSNPPVTWMFFLVFVVCCAGKGLCDGPIPHPGESYQMCVMRSNSNSLHLQSARRRGFK